MRIVVFGLSITSSWGNGHFAHLAPGDHPELYASSAWTLNVTRGAMAQMGFCPSDRLFEAAGRAWTRFSRRASS